MKPFLLEKPKYSQLFEEYNTQTLCHLFPSEQES